MSRDAPGCVIVSGMHRSGTSLTAGLLARLGVDMGTDLVPADRANPRGYFEDRDVVRFHRRAFAERLPPSDSGHADWGWTPDASVAPRDLDRWQADARGLVARRAATGRRWGFKDPRATIVLDFWHPLLPAPAYVGVYRDPTRVADSMQRLGAEVFLRNPGYAWKIWRLYNERLLDFVRRHRERCVLLNADALESNLGRLPALLRERLGLPVADVDLRGEVSAGLLHRGDEADALPRLARRVWDDCAAIHDELESLADLPSGRRLPAFTFPPRTATDGLSIVIPTHDDATWLVEALSSAVDCTQGRGEILVLDDGSTDPESLRILDRLRDAGQPVLRQANAGLSAARNALVAAARGRFILPLDSDNRLCQGFIERAIDALDRDPAVGVVYGDRRLFGGKAERRPVPEFDLLKILHRNSIDACAMFRREVWSGTGGYDIRLRGFEDWEFWIHARKLGWNFRHLPEVAFEYRVRPGSLLAQCSTPKGYADFRKLLWRKHADLLIGLTPAPVRTLARVPRSVPADLASLGPWSRFVCRTYWHRVWARRVPAPEVISEATR
jgi:glycosyltransferase involved in cell wall biosynthesis